MNQIETMHKIKTYLARFETYVRLSNVMGDLDVNSYAESFIMPVLNLVFDWELVNANHEQAKQAPGLDLIDRQRGIAVQVTADTSIGKINSSLVKIFDAGCQDNVREVYFYFLRARQGKYAKCIYKNSYGEDVEIIPDRNLIDNDDLCLLISRLKDVSRMEQVRYMLERQFSDLPFEGGISMAEYEAFREKYYACCINNYSRLNFFGLAIPKRPRELSLESLFVAPYFSVPVVPQKLGLKETPVSFNRIKSSDLFEMDHIVVLGSPGAGKSSVVKYSICKIVEGDRAYFRDEKVFDYLPIRVELIRYNAFKLKNGLGIMDYIVQNLLEEFQLAMDKDRLMDIIRTFPIFVFFDGLDEIFDVMERIAVRNDIQNFVRNNRISRTMVTSRFESYEEVGMDLLVYAMLKVEDFYEDQIEEYVRRWYSIEEANDHTRAVEIRNCLEQLGKVDRELKKNPLLLSLILILYRNEGELPTSRLDIYEGCTQTLVDKRDKKEKKFVFPFFISNKTVLFANIAYLHFINEVNKTGDVLDYTYILRFVAGYLLDKNEVESREEGMEVAGKFLEYARLRSIYFDDRFAHKTFYEYFTSYYYYVNYYDKSSHREELIQLIANNIGNASWKVVLELLILKIDQNQSDFTFIDDLISTCLNARAGETLLFFTELLRNLRYVSPGMRKRLIERAIDYMSGKGVDFVRAVALFDHVRMLITMKIHENMFIRIINRRVEDNDLYPTVYEVMMELAFSIGCPIAAPRPSAGLHFEDMWVRAKYFILYRLRGADTSYEGIALLREFREEIRDDRYIGLEFFSLYGQPMFNGAATFNWIQHIIDLVRTQEELVITEEALKLLIPAGHGLEQKLVNAVIERSNQGYEKKAAWTGRRPANQVVL